MSGEGKSMIMDTSRCTGCRGCQIACKQWNQLPASETRQTGSYQNPPDMDFNTYKVVRFSEGKHEDGKPYWYFWSDMCRHCINPPCLSGAVGDEMIHDDDTGAVVYTEGTSASDFEMAREACPYDIPRQNPETKVMSKCRMCFDRIKDGLTPACALSCPTGAIVYGDREEIMEKVNRRVELLKKKYPKAMAVDADDVRVIFIVTDDPKKYHEFASNRYA